MLENKSVSSNRPEKGVLWIVANLAGIITLADLAICYIGVIFLRCLPDGMLLFAICVFLIFFLGLWLSSRLGVWYVIRHSRIETDNIGTISKLTACTTSISLLFLSEAGNGFEDNESLSFLLTAWLFLAVPIYFFVKKSLGRIAVRKDS